MVSYTTYRHLPDKDFEVITFEVKPWDTLDVTGVYEALAHRRAANRAYLLAAMPAEKLRDPAMAERLHRIEAAAERHGVGLILAGDPEDYETWDERIEAARHDPPPQDLNQFLSLQLPDTAKEVLLSWFR